MQVVWCAGAKTTLTAELERVEEQGIVNLSKALLVSKPLAGAGKPARDCKADLIQAGLSAQKAA